MWAHFLCLAFEAVFLFAFSLSGSNFGMGVVLMVVFSCFVQAAEGTTYALVPFACPSYLVLYL
jgi:MFS transporter, NNP family, nitrate/nitrite transporter